LLPKTQGCLRCLPIGTSAKSQCYAASAYFVDSRAGRSFGEPQPEIKVGVRQKAPYYEILDAIEPRPPEDTATGDIGVRIGTKSCFITFIRLSASPRAYCSSRVLASVCSSRSLSEMAISASCNFARSSGGSTSRGRVERDHHGHDSATMNTINTARD